MKAEAGATLTHLFYLHKADFVTFVPLRGCLQSSLPLYFPWMGMWKQGGGKGAFTWKKAQPTQRKAISYRALISLRALLSKAHSLRWSQHISLEKHQFWVQTGWEGGRGGGREDDANILCRAWPAIRWLSVFLRTSARKDKSCSLYLFFPLGVGLLCLGTRFTGRPPCLIVSLPVISSARAQLQPGKQSPRASKSFHDVPGHWAWAQTCLGLNASSSGPQFSNV